MIRHYTPHSLAPFVVGIDPGLDGGIAVLALSGETIAAGSMPTAPTAKGKREIDGRTLGELLMMTFFGVKPTLVVVEKVGAMPKQGVVSMFSFGVGFGKILGAIEAHGLAHQLVTPQRWKRSILAGTDKSKEAAIAYARKRFPRVDLRATDRSQKPSDGIAEALCLAEWARRLACGEERLACGEERLACGEEKA